MIARLILIIHDCAACLPIEKVNLLLTVKRSGSKNERRLTVSPNRGVLGVTIEATSLFSVPIVLSMLKGCGSSHSWMSHHGRKHWQQWKIVFHLCDENKFEFETENRLASKPIDLRSRCWTVMAVTEANMRLFIPYVPSYCLTRICILGILADSIIHIF